MGVGTTRRTPHSAAWCAAVTLAVLLASCAPGGATVSPVPDAGVRLDARLLEMVDLRRADTSIIDAALADASSSRRSRAALAIGQVKVRARYGVLRTLLFTADTAVAANAAYALGLAKDADAVDALARAVATAPEPVSREAAWALGEVGEPARTSLLAMLGRGVDDPVTRSPAAARPPAVRAALLQSTINTAHDPG